MTRARRAPALRGCPSEQTATTQAAGAPGPPAALFSSPVAKPSDITVRCAGCGRVLAVYSEVSIDERRRARLLAHARDLLDWHRHPECAAPNAIVGERTRSSPRGAEPLNPLPDQPKRLPRALPPS